VTEGNWNHLLEGEPVLLDGSRSFFLPLHEEFVSDVLQARLQSLDVHPSAPWWGRGKPLAEGRCARLEATVLSAHTELCKGLEMAGLVQERRALRAVVREFHCQWVNDLTLNLQFSLAPGVYATTLLREIGDCRERQHDSPSISAGTMHELDSKE
jgi:tRNA pseudouridine13 synthase